MIMLVRGQTVLSPPQVRNGPVKNPWRTCPYIRSHKVPSLLVLLTVAEGNMIFDDRQTDVKTVRSVILR